MRIRSVGIHSSNDPNGTRKTNVRTMFPNHKQNHIDDYRCSLPAQLQHCDSLLSVRTGTYSDLHDDPNVIRRLLKLHAEYILPGKTWLRKKEKTGLFPKMQFGKIHNSLGPFYRTPRRVPARRMLFLRSWPALTGRFGTILTLSRACCDWWRAARMILSRMNPG